MLSPKGCSVGAVRAESGDFEMFSELHDFLEEDDVNVNSLKASINVHLQSLLEKFHQYFPTGNVENYDWIRQPFTSCSSNDLSSELEDALLELSSDRTIQTLFASKTLDEFACCAGILRIVQGCHGNSNTFRVDLSVREDIFVPGIYK